MAEPGYLYLLINVSMQGLVKIGRTQRDPDERARELSAVTGVPTPFVLVFDAYFQDCARAEEYVHTLLETKNYRLSSNREFFVVPVKEAIRAIQSAEKLLGSAEPESPASSAGVESPAAEPWQAVLALADAANYGSGGTLQDEAEALRLYDQAAKLGSAEACLSAGQLCWRSDKLHDASRALDYLKEGARRGIEDCHAEMAAIFAADGHVTNWKLCWANYFASDAFLRTRTLMRGPYVLNYIKQARMLRLPLDHRASITQASNDEALSVLDKIITSLNQKGVNSASALIDREYARQALGEKEETESLHGQVQWFNRETGAGFISLDRGDRVFFMRDDIMTLEAFTQDHAEGLSVHCRVIQGPERLIAFDVRVP